MLNSKAALVVFCSLCFLGLQAQDCHFALRGHVTELDNNEPLAYASVWIGEIQKSTLTDEKGYFEFSNLCEKTPYTVEIRHVECAHFTQIVALSENTLLEFHLPHNTILNEILIIEKATPPPPTQAVETVEKADLDAAKGINLGETLKKLPGVSLLSSGSTVAKPVIQGLHSNRIALVNDGVLLQSQQWGSDHAPEIDPFSSETVKVVKGAAGLRYGVGAMAGAVVLEPAPLRTDKGLGGWLSVGGFSNGAAGVLSGSVDWRPRNTAFAMRLQSTAKRSGNLRAPDYWLGNTGALEADFSAILEWKKPRIQQQISGSQFNQTYGILRAAHTGSLTDLRLAIDSDVPRNNLDEFSYRIDRPRQKVQHNVLKYKALFRLSDIWKADFQYNFQYNKRQEYDRGRSSVIAHNKPQITFELWTNTLDFSLEHQPWRHWQGSVGVQGFQQLNYVSRGGFIPDYQSLGGSIWVTERYRRYPMPWEFEWGLRYDYRWSHVTTVGNLRDLDQNLAFGSISGNVGALYRINPNFTARLNTGYAWRPPHVNELFARGVHQGAGTYEQGNPLLEAEKAWNSNLTLNYDADQWQAQVSVYRNAVSNFIYLNQPRDSVVLTIRGPFPAYFYEQDDAVLRGVDASLSAQLWGPLWAEGRFSTLYGQRILSSEKGGERFDWLPLMPIDRYQYGLKWQFLSATKTRAASFVRINAQTSLRQWRIPKEGLTKAAPNTFTTLALDAAHTLLLRKSSLELGFQVQNLFNVKYREYLDFFRLYADSPGVNVGVRAKWIF